MSQLICSAECSWTIESDRKDVMFMSGSLTGRGITSDTSLLPFHLCPFLQLVSAN